MIKKIKIGLKRKTDKIKFFTDSFDKNNISSNDINLSQLHFNGNKSVLIDGYKSVIEYTDSIIKINLGKAQITFSGSNLQIISMQDNEITISGKIGGVEFL